MKRYALYVYDSYPDGGADDLKDTSDDLAALLERLADGRYRPVGSSVVYHVYDFERGRKVKEGRFRDICAHRVGTYEVKPPRSSSEPVGVVIASGMLSFSEPGIYCEGCDRLLKRHRVPG